MNCSRQRDWNSKDWERYVNQLLSIHHSIFGGSYQPVPDYGGDRGLEGFTDTGEAYQSYADQDSKNNAERTRKQKKKIKDDLESLETYSDFWQDMLGDNKLHHWTLMVPNLDDKEVVKYAKRLARRLAKKGLPFIADDFHTDVKTHHEFPVAKQYMRSPHVPRMPSFEVSDGDIEKFRSSQPEFIRQLERKLKHVYQSASDEELQTQLTKWLRWHLQASNYLDGLRDTFPVLWESLDELIEVTGESLDTEGPLDSRRPDNRLRETRREFEATLQKDEFTFLATTDRATVSFGTVARWLGECPLDFQGASNG